MPTLNPKSLTDSALANFISTTQAQLSAAQSEKADREKHTRDLKSWAAGSAGRIQAMASVFRPEPVPAMPATPAATATTNGNGGHKAKRVRKAKTTGTMKPRQAYKIPGTDKVWKGYGPAPKALKAMPKEQWVTA